MTYHYIMGQRELGPDIIHNIQNIIQGTNKYTGCTTVEMNNCLLFDTICKNNDVNFGQVMFRSINITEQVHYTHAGTCPGQEVAEDTDNEDQGEANEGDK